MFTKADVVPPGMKIDIDNIVEFVSVWPHLLKDSFAYWAFPEFCEQICGNGKTDEECVIGALKTMAEFNLRVRVADVDKLLSLPPDTASFFVPSGLVPAAPLLVELGQKAKEEKKKRRGSK